MLPALAGATVGNAGATGAARAVPQKCSSSSAIGSTPRAGWWPPSMVGSNFLISE